MNSNDEHAAARDEQKEILPSANPEPGEQSAGKGPMEGIALIAAERQRQLSVEGWTPEHDDKHVGGALAMAAAQYAIPYGMRAGKRVFEWLWPWDSKWYKPSAGNRIRELEKAGALIAAEIDRLLRVEARKAPSLEPKAT